MDDDLGVPQALAQVHAAVRHGNTALSAGDKETVAAAAAELRAMLGVLGLDPLDARWADGRSGGHDAELTDVVDALVSLVLDQRQAARSRKDYATADAIRDELQRAGLVIEDTPAGPRWELGGGSN
jgi:cysteinyl-tRNA synthetase